MKRIVFNTMVHDKLTYALKGEHHEFVVREDGAGEHWINGVMRAEVPPDALEEYVLAIDGFPLEEMVK